MTNHLAHYSSPYYDPVKAHEYYMKTRKLKGTSSKTSTAGLNDDGKAAAKYVKNQLTTERKTKVTANNEASKSEIEKLVCDHFKFAGTESDRSRTAECGIQVPERRDPDRTKNNE